MSKRARSFAAGFVLLLAACHDRDVPPPSSLVETISGRVVTAWGEPVAGATVYLVPADQVPTTPITAADVRSGAAEAYDEPLEDAVASAAASAFPRATSAADGTFALPQVDTTRSFFPYVDPAGAQPADLYPGGSLSREPRTNVGLHDLTIEVTGRPSASATYVGSSTCLVCHFTLSTQELHGHRLTFRRPGVDGELQNTVRFPRFDDGLAAFADATPATSKSSGTSLWFHDYDAGRGADKFAVAQSDPGNAEVRVYLWRDTSDGQHKVTMENLVDGSDPDRTYTVALTYGGALQKQRYVLSVSDSGYQGLYPFLQFQHAGDDAYYDRTRRVWRDDHMDWYWDATAKKLTSPPKSGTVQGNCMACHTTGYRAFDDPVTGERLCDGVDDRSGVIDLDADGRPDEINTGCEVCHGPGSEHVVVARAQYIVSPALLSPERENMICGRCHDGVLGNDDRQNEQPLNPDHEMAPPGIRRADWLASYVSRKGPAPADLWDDEVHSRNNHQQYADFLKSAHHRNDRRLVVCSDCHDLHGRGAYDGDLRGDPHDGTLCARCHAVVLPDHVRAKTGSSMGGAATSCLDCHWYGTGRSGAGRYGLVLGAPTGAPSDEDLVYWENDLRSHLTAVPNKGNPGVAGAVPGQSMPVPYTNACAPCHDAASLR
jgi:hypothetical protein